jgi:mannose-1-phosphate guanylyltransferase
MSGCGPREFFPQTLRSPAAAFACNAWGCVNPPRKAFVLGAGLGTRLRPLTGQLPKPLIPVWNRPLIAFAFDRLIGAGVSELVVNTHWHPEAYNAAFPNHRWGEVPITFRHEPVLLETAGGIANVSELLGTEESFWVHNGDILTTLPLAAAVAAHAQSDAIATLVLRGHGGERVVSFDESRGRIVDIRNLLGTGAPARFQFSGIYLCRREFLDWLTPGRIESARTIFLEIIRRCNRLGGVVIDDGVWRDIGDRDAYFEAHRLMPPPREYVEPALPRGVTACGVCAIAPDAVLEPGAMIEDSIVWSGARVASNARLTRCVVRSGQTASGTAVDRDF